MGIAALGLPCLNFIERCRVWLSYEFGILCTICIFDSAYACICTLALGAEWSLLVTVGRAIQLKLVKLNTITETCSNPLF